jgi:hypothetical protein
MRERQAGTTDAAGLDTSRLSHRPRWWVNHDTAHLFGKPNRKRVVPAFSIPNGSEHMVSMRCRSPRGRRRSLMSGAGHALMRAMETTTKEIPMTDTTMALLEATERLERAETEARIADVALSTLVPDAPLRFKVRAVERARRADAELTAARAAYEAAQDVECPEA